MLSTLFPPDPTLTVDNVSHIMEKVEPKERQRVLKDIIITTSVFDAIQNSKKYSTALEVEAAAVDIYVKCFPFSSWEHVARSLYLHQQVAAVEKVRSYLPPRGEPSCGVYVLVTRYDIMLVNSLQHHWLCTINKNIGIKDFGC